LENPEYYSQIKRKAAIASYQKQSHYVKNSVEKKFEDIIEFLKVSCEYSFILNGKYQYDYRIFNKKILIEIDGDYWHGNPKFYSEFPEENKRTLNEIQKKKIEKDLCKMEYAIHNGWKLIRFWEYDIKNNPEQIIERFRNEIQIDID
jgi:very-short-patch-repair endonuclease